MTRRSALIACALTPGALVSAARAHAQDAPGGVDPARGPKWPAPKPAEAPTADPQPLVWEVIVTSKHMGKQHLVFVLPPDYETSDAVYPAVLSFAGLGESQRGNKAGAWGWVEKYGVVPAMSALHRNALTKDDFQGLVNAEELAAYNAALQKTPYKGVVLVCPYPPRKSSPAYERYLFEEVIPYTKRTLRVAQDAQGWGIDGISMGGMLSTTIGLRHMERFASIASQQSSFSANAPRLKALLGDRLDALRQKRLNIATSERDPFRPSLIKLSQALDQLDVPHRFTILRGRHDKRFVKGPGSLELLLFNDRALRGSNALPPARRPEKRRR